MGAAVRNQTRRGKSTVTTATGLAKHLGLSRQRIIQLADEGVIDRLPDTRFDETASRLKYLDFLRSPDRRSARSEAESAFVTAKTRLVEIRTQEKLGNLLPRQAVEDVLDTYVGMVTTELLSLGARVAPVDIAMRRKVDAAVHEVRKGIHARLGEKLAEFRATGEIKAEGEATDADD